MRGYGNILQCSTTIVPHLGGALAIYDSYIVGQRKLSVIITDWSVYYKQIAIQTLFRQLQAAKNLTFQSLNLYYNLL